MNAPNIVRLRASVAASPDETELFGRFSDALNDMNYLAQQWTFALLRNERPREVDVAGAERAARRVLEALARLGAGDEPSGGIS